MHFCKINIFAFVCLNNGTIAENDEVIRCLKLMICVLATDYTLLYCFIIYLVKTIFLFPPTLCPSNRHHGIKDIFSY